MKDLECNLVKIVENVNNHYLVVGNSGTGKTYWQMQRLDESVETGKRTWVLDFSGSYTKEEMLKSNPTLLNKVKFIGARDSEGIFWANNYPSSELLCDDISDSIVRVLGIKSYYQKKLLRKAVERLLKGFPNFSFPMLVFTIEKMLSGPCEEVTTKEDFNNLERLLSRLAPYETIYNFGIMKEVEEDDSCITIVQLHEMPLMKKKFLTSFLLEMIWNELKFEPSKRHCDVLVLDEFQFLSFKEDAALPNLLRESRRFGLELTLISQFISNYSKAEVNAILQVGQKLFFRPTETDLKFTASLISTDHTKNWMNTLDKLSRGEAIYKGSYALNDSEVIHTSPLVCRI